MVVDITEIDVYKLIAEEIDLYGRIKNNRTVLENETDIDENFTILIFKFLIKLFSKLNFNLAYSENHNCLIFSFTKSNKDSNTEFIEYQLLEIDNTNRQYYTKNIKYEQFIDEFINLMKKVNNKFQNNKIDNKNQFDEPHEILYFVLFYVNKFKTIIYSKSSSIKSEIEKELITSYNDFELEKNKANTEEEKFQLALMTFRNNAFRHVLN